MVDQKVSVAHAGNFLPEVNWIKLEIVVLLFVVLAWVVAKIAINGLDFDFDNFFQVSGIPQLLVIDLSALLVLTQEGLMLNTTYSRQHGASLAPLTPLGLLLALSHPNVTVLKLHF